MQVWTSLKLYHLVKVVIGIGLNQVLSHHLKQNYFILIIQVAQVCVVQLSYVSYSYTYNSGMSHHLKQNYFIY